MSVYGGCITVAGRNLITSLIAGGHTLELTRIMVGDGMLPEGTEPIDMEDLVSPLYEATSTVPVYEDGIISMTIEYRNNFDGRELQRGFWLREFGVYAKTAETEEILLYYATLGDSPQPVSAYKENRIDIRRYPITIAVLVDESVPEISYRLESYVTAAEAVALVTTEVAKEVKDVVSTIKQFDITIPASGWTEQSDGGEEPGTVYSIEIPVDGCTDSMLPMLTISRESLSVAGGCGMSPTVETVEGAIKLYAEQIPEEEIQASLALLTVGGGGGGGGGTYILPPATSNRLGGVKIGNGINVASDGTISVDHETVMTDEDLVDEDATEEDLRRILTGLENDPEEPGEPDNIEDGNQD